MGRRIRLKATLIIAPHVAHLTALMDTPGCPQEYCEVWHLRVWPAGVVWQKGYIFEAGTDITINITVLFVVVVNVLA